MIAGFSLSPKRGKEQSLPRIVYTTRRLNDPMTWFDGLTADLAVGLDHSMTQRNDSTT